MPFGRYEEIQLPVWDSNINRLLVTITAVYQAFIWVTAEQLAREQGCRVLSPVHKFVRGINVPGML